MTKNEWLSELKESLMAELPQNEIETNITYYRDYIETESKTKGEAEILSILGQPRLIAKTIIDTYELQKGTKDYTAYNDYNNYNNSSTSKEYDANNNTVNDQGRAAHGSSYSFHVKSIKWYHKAIFFAVLVLILSLIIVIGGIFLRIFFSIGLPILMIVLLLQIFRRR